MPPPVSLVPSATQIVPRQPLDWCHSTVGWRQSPPHRPLRSLSALRQLLLHPSRRPRLPPEHPLLYPQGRHSPARVCSHEHSRRRRKTRGITAQTPGHAQALLHLPPQPLLYLLRPLQTTMRGRLRVRGPADQISLNYSLNQRMGVWEVALHPLTRQA